MKLRFRRSSRSKDAPATRKRRWRYWHLVLVMLAAQASLGVGVLVGYNYWEYRTFWGDPNAPPPDVTSYGTVETETFYSEALSQTMEYKIYLPPGYDSLLHRFTHYPVVYMLHGLPGTDDDWVSKGGAADAMDTLLARGQAQPMIVVMPTGANSRWGPETGWVDGSQGDWGTYTTKDLVNEVDSNYRTIDSADSRAIAGNSEGGWAAVNLALKNPSEFGIAGSFSGYFTADDQDKRALFGEDQSLADANSPTTYLPQLKGQLPAIYLLDGQGEAENPRNAPYYEDNQKFAEELKADDATYEFDNPPGGDHDWDFWRARLPSFFVYASDHLE